MDTMLVVIAMYIPFIIGAIACGVIFIKSVVLQPFMNPNDFLGLLTILSSQVQTELDTYDKDIFENKGSITNNNFDQYYKDLNSRIIQNISQDMITALKRYYTEEAIYRFIARSVRDYLISKINGTM